MKLITENRTSRISMVIEPLEARLLWAGDVSALLKNGSLVVTGDEADNQIEITQPVAGTIRVAGLDQTTVNGQTSVDFTDVTKNLKIRAKQGGADEFQIQGAINLPGNVDAKVGDGQLIIEGTLGAVDIAGNLKATADGDIALRNTVTVHGNASIKAGGAASTVATPGIIPDFASATFSNPTNIDNPRFPLVPGAVYTSEDISSDEDTGGITVETDVFTVTNNTRTVDGITIRDVHDQSFVGGKIIEDTIDFHAQDDNGNVWYLGEDTTSFTYDAQGNLVSSSKEGSWQAGVNGAKPGIIMMANPQVGDTYFQEISPNNVLDHGEVLATNETTTVPVGTFNNVVHTKETSVVEPGDVEKKFYAPGLGTIQEETFDPRTGVQTGIVRMLSATLNGTPVTQVVSPSGFSGTNATGTNTGPVQILGKATIQSNDLAVLSKTNVGGDANIKSKSDLAVGDSVFSKSLVARAVDTIGLNSNVTVTGKTNLRSEDAFIFDSTFNSDTNIRLGSADDQLVVQGSLFGVLNANGGSGEDTFDNRGGNTIGTLNMTQFELP